MSLPEILTLDEAAKLLQVSVRQLRRWRSLGLLPFIRLGGSQRYPRIARRDLERFIEQSSDARQQSSRKRK